MRIKRRRIRDIRIKAKKHIGLIRVQIDILMVKVKDLDLKGGWCNGPCVACVTPCINSLIQGKEEPFSPQQLASVSIESPASIQRASSYSIVFYSPQRASDHYICNGHVAIVGNIRTS